MKDPKGFREMLSSLTDAELGAVLREYIGESEHGSWEGFSARDQTGIYRMLEDMALYQRNMVWDRLDNEDLASLQ